MNHKPHLIALSIPLIGLIVCPIAFYWVWLHFPTLHNIVKIATVLMLVTLLSFIAVVLREWWQEYQAFVNSEELKLNRMRRVK